MDNSKLKSKLDGKVQAMSESAEQPRPASLAPVESNYIALRGDTMDIIQANLKRQPLSLDLFDVVNPRPVALPCSPCPGWAGTRRRRS